ncbi:MAG: hypothetical protein R2778_16080 [Saprospiraceae bacterium]
MANDCILHRICPAVSVVLIYMLFRKIKKETGQAYKPGPNINTDKQELFPFISFSGTLFFSSNGRDSTLGMDIYFANNPLNNPEEIVNLGEPFNLMETTVSL